MTGFFHLTEATGREVCTAHATCGTNQYVSSAGTATSDATCGNCAALNRGNGNGVFCGPCLPTYHHTSGGGLGVGVCVEHMECSLDQYVVAEGSSSEDAECGECSALKRARGDGSACGPCLPGHHHAAASGTTTCEAHTECAYEQFESTPGTSVSDAECSACSTLRREGSTVQCGECTSGFYHPAAVGTTACTAHTTCVDGQYLATEATPTTDAVCAVCRQCTPGATYETSACTLTSDTVCSRCSQAVVGDTYIAELCTPLRDTVLRVCTRGVAGVTFVSRSCTANADALLRTCSTCGSGMYVAQPCNPSHDTQCEACTSCGAGTYEVTPCTSHAQTVCATCSSCPIGHLVAEACSAGTDTRCHYCATP